MSGVMPVALVTGASSGIGRETALGLARLGYTLVLAARGGERLDAVGEEAAALGAADVMLRSTDVGLLADVETLIDVALEAFDRIDVLVNNAGVAPLTPLGEYDAEAIERVYFVNAIGPAVAINRAWPAMVRADGGRIVNVSTIGTKDPFPGFFAYAAAKSALNSMTRSIALEGEKHGIKAFTVAPGAVETPMLRALFPTAALPPEATLSPAEVASVIVECATGQRDAQNGEVIWMCKA